MTTPTSFLHPHPYPTPTLSVLSNFVIAEMSYEWSHPVCKLWGLTFIHIAYIPWDPSQLSKSAIHPQCGWTRVCLTFTVEGHLGCFHIWALHLFVVLASVMIFLPFLGGQCGYF